jgi:tetratricopeptide (TPR) repeat protein
MNHRLVPLLFCLALSTLILNGCAFLKKKPKVEEPVDIRLERVLLERALEYERQGQSHKALQSYEAALAVIVTKKKGLEESLRKDAEEHYQRGLRYQEQGKYSKARHEFLVALRLWPDYPQVVKLLKHAPPPLSRYVVHQVKEGEYLTLIAEKYYQDQSKFKLIARFNNLDDATKISHGMKLKIPVTEEVSLRKLKEQQSSESALSDRASGEVSRDSKQEIGEEVALVEIPSSVSEGEMYYDPVAIYQEQGVILLEEGQYLAALHEFQKVLNTDPDREKVREYMAWAHYRQGEVFFNQAEYLAARDQFEKALKYDEEWTACKEYIKRVEDAYKEVHYLRGIQYFEEERLKEAIEEWQLVSKRDPDYKQVQSYLARAKKLLEKVQELKEVP